jgi:hypothetical protein
MSSKNSDLVTYYVNKLILQYAGKEKATATIQAIVEKIVIYDILVAIRDGFNIDTAVGKQLDVVGQYTGVSRELYSSLSDDDYRFLIKIAIVKNTTNGSLKEIDDLFNLFFTDKIIVFDNYDMSITITYDPFIEDIITIAKNNGIIPKPLGVKLTLVRFSDVVNGIWYTQTTVKNSDLVVSYDSEIMIVTGNDIYYGLFVIGTGADNGVISTGTGNDVIGTDDQTAYIVY